MFWQHLTFRFELGGKTYNTHICGNFQLQSNGTRGIIYLHGHMHMVYDIKLVWLDIHLSIGMCSKHPTSNLELGV